ncbi:MAG: metallophosphoesterase [Prevotella sp.]|nr:metallophosphoesterase [Prevotella sp.]
MKMMWMLIFTLLPFAGISYIAWHIWCLLPLGAIWKTLIILLMAGSFFLMFAGMRGMMNHLSLSAATAVYEIGTSSVFILLYLVIIFLVLDFGRLVHLVPRTLLYQNWWTAGAICVVMFGLFLYGDLHYQNKYRETLTLTTNKPMAKSLKLVLLSDLHIGYHNPRKELHRWVDIINSEQPDLVLIAGDIIDMSMRPLLEEKMHEEFQRIQAPVYACLGNHEYYSSEPAARQFYKDAGIHLLQDSATVVGDLCIIGRDDRTNMHRDSLGVIMKQADKGKYTILLDHQPYHLEQAERQGIDFQFSGHTHHGQVWPISWITEHVYECAFGPHQRGNTRYYVSSGMGIWGGKFRIGTRSEYVVATVSCQASK